MVGYLAKYKAIAECAQTFLSTSKHPIIFGAKFKESIHQREFTSHHYNGKVEAPRIFVNKNKKPLVEWDFSKSLDWHLLQYPPHKGLQEFFKDLNTFYKNTPALYEKAFSVEGFEWINYGDHENSVISFIEFFL